MHRPGAALAAESICRIFGAEEHNQEYRVAAERGHQGTKRKNTVVEGMMATQPEPGYFVWTRSPCSVWMSKPVNMHAHFLDDYGCIIGQTLRW